LEKYPSDGFFLTADDSIKNTNSNLWMKPEENDDIPIEAMSQR
jgi:hypothetical protein